MISGYSEYLKLGNNGIYNIFRMQTDKSIIVRLKCASYCPFYMHITSILMFLNVIAPCV